MQKHNISIISAVTVLLGGLLLFIFLHRPPVNPTGGPDLRPSEWAMTQRLFPYGDADPHVYSDAIRHVKEMYRARKSDPFGVWRFAGPTNIGGRFVDIEFDRQNPSTVYAAAATGGVFKSIDSGRSWFPIFDDQSVLTIGDIAVDPLDRNVIYVGTGEANGGHNNYAGGGIYKSVDGGNTWTYMGLAETTSIGRILIDPTDTDRIYLAAVGSYFKENPERGVYLSEDAGRNWTQVLFVSDAVGAIDLVMNPDDPDQLFAAMWERVRGYNEARLSGPGGGIYRTNDGGQNWERLGPDNGLPQSDAQTGRIGLTINRQHPEVLYALYNDGIFYSGFYKTTDGGNTWINADPDREISRGSGNFSWYFGQTRVHPQDTATVFALDVDLMRSTDGGQTWRSFFAGHADYHALAFHPNDPNYIITGHDGGISISTDGGSQWTQVFDLPVTQFYEVNIDPTNPERLYGGTQDNGTVRTTTGAVDDWHQINGGDGFYVIVDPENPGIIYTESQNGALTKLVDGVNMGAMSGITGSDPRNWATPVVMDPNNNQVLYYGTHRLYRTENGATNWTAVSESLVTELISSPKLGTITSIAVAPTNSNTIYVGTDDGNVWVSTDYAATWRNVSDALPIRWVTRVVVDPTDDRVAYVTFSGLKWRDPQPHVFRTSDQGNTWQDISGNATAFPELSLPDAPVNALAVDPENPDILFVGTDVGAFVSMDTGETWSPLGTGMPSVTVSDLKIHETGRYLAAGTHGRSMYIMDLTNLRVSNEETTPIPITPQLESVSNAPNPFRNSTQISFHSPEPQTVRLTVYDALGRQVRELAEHLTTAGRHTITWDGTGDSGRELAAGVYFARFETPDHPASAQTLKIIKID